jgi:hypothetical protein
MKQWFAVANEKGAARCEIISRTWVLLSRLHWPFRSLCGLRPARGKVARRREPIKAADRVADERELRHPPPIAFYNAYPMEFVQTKDRLIEFFDFFYVHRTIYTDGRKLPDDPDPTWYGYSVGHWDGNVLVVETTGFNDESWVDNDGHPHSDQMKLEERFERVDHDTIQARMTLADPKAYTTPWVSEVTTWTLTPKQAMREDLCAPSDELKYKEEMRDPAATKK